MNNKQHLEQQNIARSLMEVGLLGRPRGGLPKATCDLMCSAARALSELLIEKAKSNTSQGEHYAVRRAVKDTWVLDQERTDHLGRFDSNVYLRSPSFFPDGVMAMAWAIENDPSVHGLKGWIIIKDPYMGSL